MGMNEGFPKFEVPLLVSPEEGLQHVGVYILGSPYLGKLPNGVVTLLIGAFDLLTKSP